MWNSLCFSEKLPRLPPNREIEFCIDLVSDIAPVSMPPYRMATIELRELKRAIARVVE